MSTAPGGLAPTLFSSWTPESWPPAPFPRGTPAPAHLSLTTLHNNELLLGGGAGEDDLSVVLQDLIDLLGGEVLEVSAVDHAGLGVPGESREWSGHADRLTDGEGGRTRL